MLSLPKLTQWVLQTKPVLNRNLLCAGPCTKYLMALIHTILRKLCRGASIHHCPHFQDKGVQRGDIRRLNSLSGKPCIGTLRSARTCCPSMPPSPWPLLGRSCTSYACQLSLPTAPPYPWPPPPFSVSVSLPFFKNIKDDKPKLKTRIFCV